MSFSGDIKEELSKMSNLANKEAISAEFIGYLLSNNIEITKNKINYATENEYNINRLNKILNNLSIDYDISFQRRVYKITFRKQDFECIKFIENKIQINKDINNIDVKKEEQFFKALVRGTFLGGGSLNNPNNKYHLEILFKSKVNAEYIYRVLKEFYIQTKILIRKKNFSIYIKEAEEISKFLALIGANKSVLNFEEIRVERDTRNNINRLVNCETANLNKTINASVTQIQAIRYLKEHKKFEELPENLKQIAEVRLKNPDASLVELGKMLQNPIGKSGVNHRLKKICEIAEELRG